MDIGLLLPWLTVGLILAVHGAQKFFGRFAFPGPGSLSVDALVGYALSGALCGVSVLFAGALDGVRPRSRRPSPSRFPPRGA